MLLVNPVLALRQCCVEAVRQECAKQERRAGLKHFGGSIAVLGGKNNSNLESWYLFVILGRTGIGGKKIKAQQT